VKRSLTDAQRVEQLRAACEDGLPPVDTRVTELSERLGWSEETVRRYLGLARVADAFRDLREHGLIPTP
jgi:hypothetical protein